MDTYQSFPRQLKGGDESRHPARRPLPANSEQYGKPENYGKPGQWSNLDTEKGYNARFESVQDLTDDTIKPRDSSPYPNGRDHASDEALNRVRTANNITMTPELFEKLYLNPHQKVTGDLRTTFGNPTPIGLLGFLLAGSPLACEMMGWRGAGGGGIAMVAVYYFVGGFLMSLGGLLEFFLGNTFSFIVFLGYGSFWFSLGGTLTPSFNAYGAYVPNPDGNPNAGLDSPQFHATYGFYLLFMALMSFMYLVCALRTNVIFITVFFGLMMCFVLDTGSYWHLADGNTELAAKMQIAAGGFLFLAVMAGWWIFFALALASVDFPFEVPVGDISHIIKPLSEIKAAKNRYPGK